MKTLFSLLLLCSLFLSACETESQKAIKEYEALRLDREAQAEEQRTREEFERTEAQKAERYDSTKGAVTFATNVILIVVGASIAFSLASTLMILVFRFWGLTKALQKRATVWSLSVPLDPATGSFPLFVMGGHAHNPNNALVMKLGDPHDPDRQLATGHEYVRALAIATEGARQIGKTSGDAQAADAIFTTAGTIPLVGDGPFSRERAVVQNSGLPQVVKDVLDNRLAKNEGKVIDG